MYTSEIGSKNLRFCKWLQMVHYKETRNNSLKYTILSYLIASYFSMVATVWHKCLTGENFDEFDESKLPRQNFPY